VTEYVYLNPKFEDLPMIPPVTSYMYPQHDGDMEELAELADRVFCYPAREVAKLPHRYMYHQVQERTGIYPGQLLKNWDTAAEMLRRWRNE
jgi:hypothetical protein